MFGLWAPERPTEAAVRSEIWSLGARHQGRPLEGALAELEADEITSGRAALLRACVAKLRPAKVRR
ncbi:hypothetical protein [Phenylobacterium sp.]|jgi:hypothetical protein|uniref:hypothetical protein n=1 Tax=Phenylobacterium sp. TaxID=1871053 RepID=UPI002F93E639